MSLTGLVLPLAVPFVGILSRVWYHVLSYDIFSHGLVRLQYIIYFSRKKKIKSLINSRLQTIPKDCKENKENILD